jgi:AcrR family transcriptional regulator
MIDRTVFQIRRRKHARPRELLDAALSLFIEKGSAAARADEIAARAGVCKGTLYLYFDSKEDLLKELIAQRFSSRIAISLHEGTDARPSFLGSMGPSGTAGWPARRDSNPRPAA